MEVWKEWLLSEKVDVAVAVVSNTAVAAVAAAAAAADADAVVASEVAGSPHAPGDAHFASRRVADAGSAMRTVVR